MPLFSWYFPMSWRVGTVVFVGAGIVLLGIAAYLTWQPTVELLHWPRVDARVERAEVVDLPDTSTTSYAARLWLAYRFKGREYRVQTDAHLGSEAYADVAKAVLDANEAGHVMVMLNPQNPEAAEPRVGTLWMLFLAPIVIGSIGLVFSALGVACLVMGRRQGFGKVADWKTKDPRVVWKACAGAGAVCVIAGIAAGVLGSQGSSWIPAQAQVESADVARVFVTNNNDRTLQFAVRRWLTYALAGRTYRSAVTGETSSDAAEAARWASAVPVSRQMNVIVDPDNPFRVMTSRPGPMDTVLMVGIFGGIGVSFIGAALFLRRQMPKEDSSVPPRSGDSTSPQKN